MADGQAEYQRFAEADRQRDKRERQPAAKPERAPAVVRSCASCLAFADNSASGNVGECRAKPPVIAVTEGGVETVWPVVYGRHWCMAWKLAA